VEDSDDDFYACYKAGVTGYVVKPPRHQQLTQALQNLCAYWYNTVKLPREKCAD
jgi:hypothetical protein